MHSPSSESPSRSSNSEHRTSNSHCQISNFEVRGDCICRVAGVPCVGGSVRVIGRMRVRSVVAHVVPRARVYICCGPGRLRDACPRACMRAHCLCVCTFMSAHMHARICLTRRLSQMVVECVHTICRDMTRCEATLCDTT